jgi:hypothetical protein
VIWSTGTPSIGDDLALANEIKAVAPGVATAVFGTHVTALDEVCLRDTPGLDAIFRNEPEATAADWIARLERSESKASVAGLTYREGGPIRRNPSAFLRPRPPRSACLFDLGVCGCRSGRSVFR